MKAVINKVELKKIFNRYYFKITLTDINGCNYVIDKPFISDPISFRRQVFGIMSACGSYDLMRLATDNPVSKKVVGYYINGLKVLENEKNEWFLFDSKTDEYVCELTNEVRKKAMDIIIEEVGRECGIKAEGTINSITSRSGVFSMLFTGEHIGTYFTCGKQIYYGFGEPINIGAPNDKEGSKRNAGYYQSFIVNLMKFYGIDDLLHFGGICDKLPIVEINFKNDKIDSITNLNTGLGFLLNEKYKFVNIFDTKKTRVK